LRADIVVDLGFGDAGKGLLTDFLARQYEAGVVVRYNGGAQAGHNVVLADGRQHTFSQFGSGTFLPRVKTFLSRHVVVHPTALLIEGNYLERKGVADPFSRLRISDQCLVITPFHQAANRIREMIRGVDRHGSCGVGVGETVEDSFSHPENCILAGDLFNPILLRKKLTSIRKHKRDQINSLLKEDTNGSVLAQEYNVFERDEVIDAWVSSVARIAELGMVAPESVLRHWLHETEHAIFEGAQGVLLDGDAGFHPYTTWSRCTTANAVELIQKLIPNATVHKIGAMRSYMVRHGPGPLPTETGALASAISEHNTINDWQGSVRYGWFDAVLARYAIEVTDSVDSLMITHMDMLPRLGEWKYSQGYVNGQSLFPSIFEAEVSDNVLKNFHFPKSPSIETQSQLTQALFHIAPMIEACDTDEETVIQKIELLTGCSVKMVSRGPSARDVQVLKSFPS